MFLEKIKKIKTAFIRELKAPRVDIYSEFSKKSFNMIAEIKKTSPDVATATNEIDIVESAKEYIDAGINILSVATEEVYFKGNIKHIRQIREKFSNAIIVRKDYILDTYQIYESKVIGSDMVYINLSLLSFSKAQELIGLAHSIGLYVVLEVDNEIELKQALRLNVKFIGINCRDNDTYEYSIENAKKLAKFIQNDKFFITECNLEDDGNIDEIKSLGYKGAIISASTVV